MDIIHRIIISSSNTGKAITDKSIIIILQEAGIKAINNLNIKITKAIIATKIIKHNNIYQKTNKTKTTHLNNKTLINLKIIINSHLVKARML